MVTRILSKEEEDFIKQNNQDIRKYVLATDALAFIVNPENPVERVTSEDLKKIFQESIKSGRN